MLPSLRPHRHCVQHEAHGVVLDVPQRLCAKQSAPLYKLYPAAGLPVLGPCLAGHLRAILPVLRISRTSSKLPLRVMPCPQAVLAAICHHSCPMASCSAATLAVVSQTWRPATWAACPTLRAWRSPRAPLACSTALCPRAVPQVRRSWALCSVLRAQLLGHDLPCEVGGRAGKWRLILAGRDMPQLDLGRG